MADSSSSRKKDYSSQVRKKLASSSRTGQACDRCKLRKIRCDADPNGCAGCRAAAEPCETTDRITRKAFRRGHTDQLEVENANLKAKLHDAQQKLIGMGMPISPDPFVMESGSGDDAHSLDTRQPSALHLDGDRRPSLASSIDESIWQKHVNHSSGSTYSNPAFTMLRGTKLSLFGMQIDLAEFAEDYTDLESPQTFSGFVSQATSSIGRNHAQPPPLPADLKQARDYARWYFTFLNTYTPLLNKREMDALLVEVYNDPRPGPRAGRTAAQEVIVHMMLSYIKFQYGQRNQMQTMIDEAMAHFKYSVSFVQDLLRSRTFRDIQAMSLLVLQLRGFRRPGACWIFGQLTINLAIECGLHRSADSLSPSEKAQLDLATIEARKRVFWALYGLISNNSTRLGRPPTLRLSDIDIEFPLPVHDYLEHEEGTLTEFQKCSYQVGITIAKLLALFSDLHSTFYSLSKPSAAEYPRLVARYKNDLDSWRADVPPEITEFATAENELAMYAMYLDLFEAEFRFLLFHPIIQPSNQTATYKGNVAACEAAISDARSLLLKIKDLKSLDVPWHTTTLLLAMTFTQLFIGDQRASEITEMSYQKLVAEMDSWLELFGTVGEMLGSGARLQLAVEPIVKNVLERLRGILDGTDVNVSGAASYHGTKAYSTQPAPHIKHETDTIYGTSTVHALNSSMQPYASTAGRTTFGSYSEGQNTYSAAPLPYTSQSYSTSTQHAKQVPNAPTAVSASYPAAGSLNYYQGHDTSSSSRTANPATDWMRWSQAHLNPFAQQTQPEYAAPLSTNTLMTMSDVRSTNSISRGHASEAQSHQWPFNYCSGTQYATSHAG